MGDCEQAEPFDTKYPRYSVRAGVSDDVLKAQTRGIHVMPYTNGQLMDPTLPEWLSEAASTAACGCWNATLVVPAPRTKNGTEGLVPCGPDGKPGYYSEKYIYSFNHTPFSKIWQPLKLSVLLSPIADICQVGNVDILLNGAGMRTTMLSCRHVPLL